MEQSGKKPRKLYETPQAADVIGVSPATLTTWRCTKRVSVPYIKLGGKVLYDETDLLAFLESCKVTK